MVNPRVFIEVQGKKRGLLFTPSLYKVCKDRGWDITTTSDLADIQSAYIKLFYAAAVNFDEIERFNDPQREAFDFTLSDMEIWAMLYKEEFARVFNIAYECLTGKSLKEAAVEIQESTKKKSLWLGIMKLLRLS